MPKTKILWANWLHPDPLGELMPQWGCLLLRGRREGKGGLLIRGTEGSRQEMEREGKGIPPPLEVKVNRIITEPQEHVIERLLSR